MPLTLIPDGCTGILIASEEAGGRRTHLRSPFAYLQRPRTAPGIAHPSWARHTHSLGREWRTEPRTYTHARSSAAASHCAAQYIHRRHDILIASEESGGRRHAPTLTMRPSAAASHCAAQYTTHRGHGILIASEEAGGRRAHLRSPCAHLRRHRTAQDIEYTHRGHGVVIASEEAGGRRTHLRSPCAHLRRPRTAPRSTPPIVGTAYS